MSELKRQVDREEFDEIKEYQEQNHNSIESAKWFGLSLVEVNKIYSLDNYEDYEESFKEKPSENKLSQNEEKILPAQRGYLRKIIADKHEENESLRDTRDSLANQIKTLWGMLRLLERRKMDLEKNIETMQDYIKKGVIFVETRIEK